jgi:alpha-mannosidase
VSGNYVPMNAAATLTDGATQFSLLNDRSQGVASMLDGQLEVMIHRRTLRDDNRGVGEPLDEQSNISPYPLYLRYGAPLIITGKHYLAFGNASAAASQWRPLMQRVYQPLVEAFAPLAGGQPAVAPYIASHTVESSYMAVDLPTNIDVITFQSWTQWTGRNATFLLRLAHQFAVGEDATLSLPVTIDLARIFVQAPSMIEETSLTANADVHSLKANKLKWHTHGANAEFGLDAPESTPIEGTTVTLNPMQIRTFIITFEGGADSGGVKSATKLIDAEDR